MQQHRRARNAFVFLVLGLSFGLVSGADAVQGNCQKIKAACEAAGFVKGGGQKGNGLKKDCIDPLMAGNGPRKKTTIPLPQIDAQTIAACQTEAPNFGGGAAAAPPSSQPGAPEQPKPLAAGSPKGPNIVFILADDFSMNLISSHDNVLNQSMPNLKKMMEEGATFTNYFVTDSLCCPSRSSIFTGKFPHNSGVFTNSPPWGGYGGFMAHNNEPHTFAVSLHEAGYKTAMLGKYLNGYKPPTSGIPLGWSEWHVDGEKGYSEYDYPLNDNGTVNTHPEYLTDEISTLGQTFIKDAASGSFLIELASFAPHAPYVPPKRYLNDFPALAYDKTPLYGIRPDATAPEWLKQIPALTQKDDDAITAAFRNRVRSDHAIDDMIGAVRAELAKLGVDKNTYIVFSADNGYHMGEYSLRPGKMTPFDSDINVPLVIVGPGIKPGSTVKDIVENTDLAPTFNELAGAKTALEPDGHSFVGLLHPVTSGAPADWRHMALIEHHHPGPDKTDPDLPEPSSGNPPSYEAIRSADALYVEYSDTKNEIGYYDLKSDPMELHNIADTLSPDKLKQLHAILTENTACKGTQSCWTAQSK
jgi:N-acetylglucosamine-6-sulfatase